MVLDEERKLENCYGIMIFIYQLGNILNFIFIMSFGKNEMNKI